MTHTPKGFRGKGRDIVRGHIIGRRNISIPFPINPVGIVGHILLRSGSYGLSKCMHRFLIGYALAYNRRHHRHGHLFQNRYKSIVCDEDSYFLELVRYIHLNPLRARLVKDISKLDRYCWCGHCVLMGRIKHEWQDRDYVLSWFGEKEGKAKKAYRQYIPNFRPQTPYGIRFYGGMPKPDKKV